MHLDKYYSNIDIDKTLIVLIGGYRLRKSKMMNWRFKDGIKISTKDLDYKQIKLLI